MPEIMELVPPELDLWSVNASQLAIERYEDIAISPINTVDTASLCEFFINGFTTSVKLLSEMYLVGTIQIVKKDGKNYSSADEIQPSFINGGLMSLFRAANLYFNQVLVANQTDNLGIVDYIQNCLNFSGPTISAKLSNQGFYTLDSADGLKTQLENSKKLQLMTRINMCNTEKVLIPNVSVGLLSYFLITPSFTSSRERQKQLQPRHLMERPPPHQQNVMRHDNNPCWSKFNRDKFIVERSQAVNCSFGLFGKRNLCGKQTHQSSKICTLQSQGCVLHHQ